MYAPCWLGPPKPRFRRRQSHFIARHARCSQTGVLDAISVPDINLYAAWLGFAAGVASGAVAGLGFHDDRFAGGYDSWRRRLMRLGHIAFFGIGLLNLCLAATTLFPGWGDVPTWAATSLASAVVLMPAVCFLSAWRKGFRHLFALPVLAVSAGIFGVLYARVLL